MHVIINTLNCLYGVMEMHPVAQGSALFLMERYLEAREAFLEGLALDPNSKALQVCINGTFLSVCGVCGKLRLFTCGCCAEGLAVDLKSKALRVRMNGMCVGSCGVCNKYRLCSRVDAAPRAKGMRQSTPRPNTLPLY